MTKIRVFIERSKDGRKYGAYMPDDNKLPFGMIGEGDTVQAAIEDFRTSFEEMRAFLREEGKAFDKEVELVFSYDVASFLD